MGFMGYVGGIYSVWEKHRIWYVVWYWWRYGTGKYSSVRYDTLAVWYDGTVSGIYFE